ncbi:hypothetical protein BDR04DRAFT_1016785, partial [Suillus decipiens]
IFGILKQCFHILLLSPEYKMDIQAHIPVALCPIHNFIWIHDLAKDPLPLTHIVNNNPSHQGYAVEDENGPQVQAENAHCGHIVTHMWEDYEVFLCKEDLEGIDHILDVELSEEDEGENDLYHGHEGDEENENSA